MATTKLILVGGFLGAGKTTLLSQAARRLATRGIRVGLVANDQATDLVDTELLKETGSQVEEVAGGCFCCRFTDMVAAMERLVRTGGIDVLIGEPVGSCTDLSATVLQPLKDLHGAAFQLAPFTVLVDGNQVRVLDRLRAAAEMHEASRFPDNVLYIYQKQLEEADVIVLNKVDLLSAAELAQLKASLAERLPGTPILTMSALDGSGVDAWLDLLAGSSPVGQKIAEVDYDTYAAGEAALGWLNAAVRLRAEKAVDWRRFAESLMETARGELAARSAEIAHLKISLASGDRRLTANLTASAGRLSLRGQAAESAREALLVVNARVHLDPEELSDVIQRALVEAAGMEIFFTLEQLQSFRPGRPEPLHRYAEVAGDARHG